MKMNMQAEISSGICSSNLYSSGGERNPARMDNSDRVLKAYCRKTVVYTRNVLQAIVHTTNFCIIKSHQKTRVLGNGTTGILDSES
jgi:hypothetical protein